jgi:hypothetical protein
VELSLTLSIHSCCIEMEGPTQVVSGGGACFYVLFFQHGISPV